MHADYEPDQVNKHMHQMPQPVMLRCSIAAFFKLTDCPVMLFLAFLFCSSRQSGCHPSGST